MAETYGLTPNQMRRAEQMLAGNATLASVADALGQPFEAVVLGVFGGGAAWEPPAFENTQRESGTARKAPGGQPLPGNGDIGDLKQGAQPAPRINPEAKASTDGGATEQAAERPADSVAGDVSRPSAGGGTGASIQPETANDCPQPPETDRRLSAAGPKDTAGRQSAVPLRAERERPGEGVTAGRDRQPDSVPERRYRLRNEIGEYLHKSGRGMTRAIVHAWTGTNAQLEEALRRVPHLKDLDVEPVPMSKGSS